MLADRFAAAAEAALTVFRREFSDLGVFSS
jgi:hypothetical protein